MQWERIILLVLAASGWVAFAWYRFAVVGREELIDEATGILESTVKRLETGDIKVVDSRRAMNDAIPLMRAATRREDIAVGAAFWLHEHQDNNGGDGR